MLTVFAWSGRRKNGGPNPCSTIYLECVCYRVTGHLSEGSSLRNVVVQIPKFDAKPNPKPNPSPSPNPNPMPILFGQMTLRTSELLPCYRTNFLGGLGTIQPICAESVVEHKSTNRAGSYPQHWRSFNCAVSAALAEVCALLSAVLVCFKLSSLLIGYRPT